MEKSFECTPEIIKIEAQFEEMPHTLHITIENDDSDKHATILYKDVKGFRVLDEGDMLDFWENKDMPESWIWKIISGGWLDGEKKNDGATLLSIKSDQLKEYFVVGCGMCVNVICRGDELPIVTLID